MPRLADSLFVRLAVLAGLLALPTMASAQGASDAPPAHVSVVDGGALLERDGGSEAAAASMPLLAGDRIRTQGGRVEVLFGDGSTLHLDANTLVDFQSDAVVRLLDGRVRLNIAGTTRGVAYRIDAPAAWVEVRSAGEYRVAVADGNEVELAVLRGAADLINEDGRTSIGAGERAFARTGSRPSSAYVYNSAAWDSFDRWSEARRDSRLGVAAEYLPESVQPYASTFNEYGTWRNVDTYGYVWYPRVSVGWRPYYRGRWTTLRPWGWTWVGYDPWAWPTHHYGRWGFSAGAWFWIPGNTWGPAYVSWAYAPGYVSWCPLGWNNVAVLQFGYAGRRYYDPWHAWTVVPHRGFGRGDVHVNVVNVNRIDVRTRNSFAVRTSAPDYRGYAVPRSAAPIRTAASRSTTFGDTAAFRSYSRSAPASGAAAPANDAAAAFRSRGTNAGRQGPGYPEPARPPQAVPRGGVAAAPDRGDAASRSRSGSVGMTRSPSAATPSREYAPSRENVPSRSRVAEASPSGEPSPAERRAVPRSAPAPAPSVPSAAQPSPDLSAFGRRTREYRTSPEAAPSRPATAERPDGYPRAVPRGAAPDNRSNRPDSSVYAPRREYSAPQSSPAERTPSYRREGPASRPQGMDRPAPAPPRASEPSRAPDRSAAPSRSGGEGSRSRGGAESSGRARSRGGN